jgi:hypothetical protein
MNPTDEQLDLEFFWTPAELERCRNLYSMDQWCMRQPGHDGDHAAGFGDGRNRWSE